MVILDDNFIGKIGTYDNLIEEFLIIQKFPILGPYKLNSSKFTVTLNKLNNEDVEFITDTFNAADIYQMILPYIHGTPLNKLFNNEGIYIDSINNWMDQLLALLFLIDEIRILNEIELYHNDLDLPNIIYNEIEKKMYLVDFGLASVKTEETEEDETLNINDIITNFISGIISRSPVKE